MVSVKEVVSATSNVTHAALGALASIATDAWNRAEVNRGEEATDATLPQHVETPCDQSGSQPCSDPTAPQTSHSKHRTTARRCALYVSCALLVATLAYSTRRGEVGVAAVWTLAQSPCLMQVGLGLWGQRHRYASIVFACAASGAVIVATLVCSTYRDEAGVAAAWTVAQSPCLIQMGLGLIALRVHDALPGSLLARAPGTPTATAEIRLVGNYLWHAAWAIAVPLIPLLAITNLLTGLVLDKHGYALVDPTTQMLLPLLRHAPWLLVIGAARCCYAVHRYSKVFLLWSVLGLAVVVAATLTIDDFVQAVQAAAPSAPSLLEVYRGVAAWVTSLTPYNAAVIAPAAVGILSIAPAVRRLVATIGRNAFTAVKEVVIFATRPQIIACVGIAVLIAARWPVPPWEAVAIAALATCSYVAIELHRVSTLAYTLVAIVCSASTMLFLAVTVVISFTIQKLPQLTTTDVTRIAAAYQVRSGSATTTDYAWMAVSELPSLIGLGVKAAAVIAAFTNPTTATIMMAGAQFIT